MHSHVVEFLSVVFAHFNALSIIVRRCLKSLQVKSEALILFQLSRIRKWNTHTVQRTLGITKKKVIIWVIKEQNLHKFVLRTLMFWNEHRWNLMVFLAWHVIESLLHKEELFLIFSAKKLICIGEKSVPQTACLLSEVNKYTAEPSFGSTCNTSSRRAQISTEINIKLFTRMRIKRRDRWRYFLISLNFYQTIQESSPQTRFMFDIKKLLLINVLTFIPGETEDSRPVENCNRFARISSNSQRRSHSWLQQSRKYRTTCNTALLHSSVCYCFALLRFIMKLIYCGVLFLREFYITASWSIKWQLYGK